MAGNIQLEVVTPSKEVVNEETQMVVAPGSLGEFGVLIGHTPFMTSLKVGTLRYTDTGGKEHYVFVSGGFAEALPDKVTVLAESAERRRDIDIERAKSALERAQQRLDKATDEVDYARVNVGVTAMPRVGLNPYALGMRLFQYIENCADKGRFSVAFQRLLDAEGRKRFDEHTGAGQQIIFSIRENLSDFLFISTFLDQDFVNDNNLFVAGRRANRQKMTWEYYVKSRKADDYRKMIVDTLYHPPHVEIDESKRGDGALYLVHHFEGKPLIKDYIPNTLLGIEFLWGAHVFGTRAVETWIMLAKLVVDLHQLRFRP